MHQFGRLTDLERQQQRARHREQQAKARARLTDRERQQEWDRNREQHAEARARLTDLDRQQERDRDRERHRQARGQQALHTTACVPLSEFDEASVPVLDIGGRLAEC
ncbi:unnamed protein product [Sphagnum jensenii]|uniref:Uncharacterized protein n=1 Tax=Sphagnum jensenii TaxID=128206 RepID=A0ABP1ALZ0_9BRYO